MLVRLAGILMMSTVAAVPEEILVVRPGAYATEDLASVQAVPHWSALCVEGRRGRIVPAILDRAPPLLHLVGERLSVRQCPGALIAMSGTRWKVGPVVTAQIAGDAVLFQGTNYMVRGVGTGPDVGRDLVLESGGRQTVLREGDPSAEFRLLWAGDLDRDGLLDLVLLQTAGGPQWQTDIPFLFLSSRAAPGAPLGAIGLRGIPAVRRFTPPR